ncbi:hypothetical protein BU17DRAFT_75556 [Hysterangium stoloniferum]|nr:hypothetical protein BU17DRAFT_75556 [Hysterangium stoloniferum]
MIPKLFYLSLLLISGSKAYNLVREHSGSTFFDSWAFYGSFDNLTSGDVNWVNQSTAVTENLISMNAAQNVIIRVDNTTNVPFNLKRDTVRITSTDSYDFGSLWVFNVVHLPYGCSSTFILALFFGLQLTITGALWPDDGEIDIVEGVNMMTQNQMAVHTLPGLALSECTSNYFIFLHHCSTASGCTVLDTTQQASFGPAFAQAQGGIWATQFDVAGIFIWFWNRASIPANLQPSAPSGSLDVSTWGPPVASYPSTACNMSHFFGPQTLVIDITLCVYSQTCAGSGGDTSACYADNVPGPGSPRFDNAYFEISYIRAYTTGVVSSTAVPTSTSSTPATTSNSVNESAFTLSPNTGIPNANTNLNTAVGGMDLISFAVAGSLGLAGIVLGMLLV